MHTLLLYDYVDDYLTRRQPHRAAHLAYAQASVDRGELVLGGAFDGPPNGAALVFRGDSVATAEAFAQSDPYVLNGVVTAWRTRRWNTVVGGK
ncbi:MAG TPA: YciI-like protein [Bryobacteraceae bacterium]|nr:YciI-like protein [Bryobacteraceae bacterium]